MNEDSLSTNLNFIGSSTNPKGEGESVPTGLLKDFNSRIVMGGDQPDLFKHDLELRLVGDGTGAKATRYIKLIDFILEVSTGNIKSTVEDVPFEIWDVEADERINAIFVDNSALDTADGFLSDDTTFDETLDIIIPVYSAYDGALHTVTDSNAAWMLYFEQEDTIELAADSSVIAAGWTTGDIYSFHINNHIVPSEDRIIVSTFGTTVATDSAYKAETDRINVFPNPYFGQNMEEINSLIRFVTFTHLPPSDATIRIFTLSGHLVQAIQHTNGTNIERWDLNNRDGIPVASGMYIAHIELPDGSSRILKLAVFIPEERLGLF